MWAQFQLVLTRAFGLKLLSKMELYLALNNLRAVLFNDLPLLGGQLSKPFCAALLSTLYCVCTGLRVSEGYLPSVVWRC